MVRDNTNTTGQPPKFKVLTRANIDKSPEWQRLPEEIQESVKTVSAVLPFRVNQYVLDELIDWSNVPDDPMFQLTFPQRGMLSDEHYTTMRKLIREDAEKAEIEEAANRIRLEL
ncbi:MAG: lysine 2,3-aminomutase, partial [Phycisphaerales bacterium JB061]